MEVFTSFLIAFIAILLFAPTVFIFAIGCNILADFLSQTFGTRTLNPLTATQEDLEKRHGAEIAQEIIATRRSFFAVGTAEQNHH